MKKLLLIGSICLLTAVDYHAYHAWVILATGAAVGLAALVLSFERRTA